MCKFEGQIICFFPSVGGEYSAATLFLCWNMIQLPCFKAVSSNLLQSGFLYLDSTNFPLPSFKTIFMWTNLILKPPLFGATLL